MLPSPFPFPVGDPFEDGVRAKNIIRKRFNFSFISESVIELGVSDLEMVANTRRHKIEKSFIFKNCQQKWKLTMNA
jgi:hypothetical protein